MTVRWGNYTFVLVLLENGGLCMGARDIIRQYLIEKGSGHIFTNAELREMTGIIESVRRLRELRDDEGFNILSHRDDPSLKRYEYRLGAPLRLPVNLNKPSKREFAMHLAKHPWCDICKKMAGDRSERDPLLLAKLNVVRKDDGSLLVLCDSCEHVNDPEQVSIYEPASLEERIMVSPRHIKKSIIDYLAGRSRMESEMDG